MTSSMQSHLHITFLSLGSRKPCRSSHGVASAAPRISSRALPKTKTTPKVDSRKDLSSMGHAKFEPSIWGDFFLSYSNPLAASDNQRRMEERAEYLKKEVAKLIVNSRTGSLSEGLHLMYVLERLCLDHLFEQEIAAVLDEISDADVTGCELHTVALWFYLLRKHRRRVSADVFLKFRDETGAFAAEDAKDLLSLYNAAHLRTHGETILDEAISFTKMHLRSLMPNVIEGSLAHDIKCAFEIPLPRRVRIYEAKYFMSTYEKEASVNEMIMELAKLSYNIMQIHHQEELKIITRDRVVECYFWIAGVYFEPYYSRGRIILTKVLAIVSILDDIYDVYGSREECEQFTKCIESWDPKMGIYLPDLLKFAFEKILDTYQNIEDELLLEEKYRMSYLKNFEYRDLKTL
uniref:Terpene synthase N-terminal domain-containing protein n=1 Tax=Oryza brachyantha TaxID=4533 RepID=J3LDB7_ORYBR